MLRMAERGSGNAEKDQQVVTSLGANGNTRAGAHANGISPSLIHALHAAEENERALERRLHRVRDRKGLELLRTLRARIADLKEQLAGGESR